MLSIVSRVKSKIKSLFKFKREKRNDFVYVIELSHSPQNNLRIKNLEKEETECLHTSTFYPLNHIAHPTILSILLMSNFLALRDVLLLDSILNVSKSKILFWKDILGSNMTLHNLQLQVTYSHSHYYMRSYEARMYLLRGILKGKVDQLQKWLKRRKLRMDVLSIVVTILVTPYYYMPVFDFPTFAAKYDNFIDGKFVAPIDGAYFDNVSPIDGKVFTRAARSNHKDIDAAISAAEKAAPAWALTSATERSMILLKCADIIEKNLMHLATVECVDNGKSIRECIAADLPLCVDHFRYFAGVIRADEGSSTEIDSKTVCMIVREPLGIIAQIIPWNFPLLMAVWKLAPALAAGNVCVMKPAEQTPTSIMILMDLLKEVIPAGVVNVVTGFGLEAGAPLSTSTRVHKVAFTGSTEVGQIILNATSKNMIPCSLELGGKSPLIFMKSIMDKDDGLLDRALEAACGFALNQGEVCTCPSRILIDESIADAFISRMLARVAAIKVGNPLDTDTMMGAQVSLEQMETIKRYLAIGKAEGAQVLAGGGVGNSVAGGYYIQPTVFKGNNKMRVFQEEIFGPVVSVTTFKDEADCISIANDTTYGLGAGLFTRDTHESYGVARAIKAGRVWVNCYHIYPAGAPFGGYKKSGGLSRECHKDMLDSYRNTKNILISYDKSRMGFF